MRAEEEEEEEEMTRFLDLGDAQLMALLPCCFRTTRRLGFCLGDDTFLRSWGEDSCFSIRLVRPFSSPDTSAGSDPVRHILEEGAVQCLLMALWIE